MSKVRAHYPYRTRFCLIPGLVLVDGDVNVGHLQEPHQPRIRVLRTRNFNSIQLDKIEEKNIQIEIVTNFLHTYFNSYILLSDFFTANIGREIRLD